jgi:thioredoxin reductase
MIDSIRVTNMGENYTTATVTITSTTGKGATAIAEISNGSISAINVTNPGTGYKDATVVIVGDGTDATASATLINDIDKVESYGDNNSFKREAESFVFNDRNPFGEVDPD